VNIHEGYIRFRPVALDLGMIDRYRPFE
jgi:hypothetical protein